MSTLSVPPVLTNPSNDAIQLYRAFKGMFSLSFSVSGEICCLFQWLLVFEIIKKKGCFLPNLFIER